MAKVLVPIGMHRSGTSLLARYLVESGVYMGRELLGKHSTNPAGHYEDIEFLNLHNDILASHQQDFKVKSKIQWDINQEFQQRAQALVSDRNQHAIWGWKDPRTSLFLDFWQMLIPDCCYLICYRHYMPVIKSLITRDITFYKEETSRVQRLLHPRYTSKEITTAGNEYLAVWIHYYSEILAHVQHTNLRYIAIPFEDLTNGSFGKLEGLHEQGYALHPPKNFNPQLTRSKKQMSLEYIPDPALVRNAEEIDQHFKQLFKNSSPF